MAYEVDVMVASAKYLKNVNWRHGPNRPYAVVWVDSGKKCTTKVDEKGDTCPQWDETVHVSLPGALDDNTTLFIEVVHAGDEEGTKKLIGSAKLKVKEVMDEVGLGQRAFRNLKLKRPSGRPHGKIDVNVAVKQPHYAPSGGYSAPPYGVPPHGASRDYPAAPPSYGNPGYGQPPQAAYGQPSYGGGYPAAPPAYGQPTYGGGYGAGQAVPGYGRVEEKKKSKVGGFGAGLALGAVAIGATALGGIALAEGYEAFEGHIADKAADRMEDRQREREHDLGYDF